MIDEQAQSLSKYRLNKAKNLLTQSELLLTNHQQDNDYEDFYVPSEAEAQEQYDNATRFIGEIERKRELFIKGKLSLPTITQ